MSKTFIKTILTFYVFVFNYNVPKNSDGVVNLFAQL